MVLRDVVVVVVVETVTEDRGKDRCVCSHTLAESKGWPTRVPLMPAAYPARTLFMIDCAENEASDNDVSCDTTDEVGLFEELVAMARLMMMPFTVG